VLPVLTPSSTCAGILLVTLLVELVTVVLRFGFKLRSNTHTRRLAALTAGRRIHHAYLGIAMLLASLFMERGSALHMVCFIAGSGVALSDLVHHYLVLLPLTGSAEFDLTYPDDGRAEHLESAGEETASAGATAGP
jgi:hypothetical protein